MKISLTRDEFEAMLGFKLSDWEWNYMLNHNREEVMNATRTAEASPTAGN